MAEKEQAKENELTEKVVSEAEELPKTIVRRVVKDKLSQLSSDAEISILRDSLQAFSESARIFIHYLSATANDTCKESNRQIISAEDVFKALEEIEFSEFIGPLRASLEEFRQKNAGRKSTSSKAKDTNKKTNTKEPPAQSESGKNPREVESEENEENASKAKGKTSKKAKRKEPTAKSDSGKKQRAVESDEDEDNAPKAKGKTNKKAKRKEPTAESEGRKNQREVESDEDSEDAD
ncbi:hypothetical protein BUALT_Bualt02G0026700 [Buddleja alternifolia]|uniref:Transcription factor CBF/NF-Y/archaeal histone domain-containing protein n=1 Tax=Buddleja alternifolia TaxID=168488 RepID=A0AAV6XX14_9LAMI|nr:hypothetical protein BUALT_Bualt02G0026700 [Buddleja alternifolia]